MRIMYCYIRQKAHGVALIVTPEVGVSDVKYVNERMMGLTTQVGNSYLDLIQVYAPHQGRSEAEK